jgi:hypothetical protein
MEHLSEEELAAQLDALVRANDKLRRENELYESFVARNVADSDTAVDAGKKDRKKRRGADKKSQALPVLLTTQQKLEIANAEGEAIQREISDAKAKSEKLIDTLKSVIEETDIRVSDLKKDAYEFKRDIVVGAENFRTGKTMAEKVIRYMEEKLRQKEAMVRKLKSKNSTIKSQIAKVDSQLRQKEEMGDVLHYIDFHQLQIENKQYVAKIEERNQELLKLKMTTGSTVQVLNTLKKQLQDIITESDWLRKEIKARTDMLKKIKRDNVVVGDEIITERRRLKKFASARDETEGLPEVLDYVLQKKEVYELETTIKNWERKLEIADMEARVVRSQRAAQRRSGVLRG